MQNPDESLTPAGYRFPLVANGNPKTLPEPEPVTFPFGLRFYRHAGPICEVAVPPGYRYSHTDQLAVTDDEVETPIIDVPYLDAEKSTTGYTDGGRPRGEEFNIDDTYHGLP